MRLSLSSLLLLSGLAAADTCPYAERAEKANERRAACPHAAPVAQRAVAPRTEPAAGKKGVFFHNRISPGTSQLYISNADGTDARLLLGNNTVYEYDAQWSPDAEWIVFSSERNGDGNTDVWRVRPDGSELQEVAATPSVETAGSLSPDGTLVAFSATYNNWKSNIWLQDLTTGVSWVSDMSSFEGDSS